MLLKTGKQYFFFTNYSLSCFFFKASSLDSARRKLCPEMRFTTALVFLWLVCVLAGQVSGGPVTGTACVAACNAAWLVCVGGITIWTAGSGFWGALVTCNELQQLCFAACTVGAACPTP